MTLQDELAATAPSNARPFAGFIADAATIWPDPRLFAWLLVAVGMRETGWRNVRGADGHGCGLMQIDDRAWRAWCTTYNAFDPEANIRKGAEILAWGLKLFSPNWQAGIAAYNCGPGNVHKGLALTPPDPDARTTDANYGADVIRRCKLYKPPDLVLPF